jgi:hypothetical protein
MVEGVLRAGMVVAMAAMFVIALTIPEAWQDAPGGLNGPLVLVGAYLLVRCVHLVAGPRRCCSPVPSWWRGPASISPPGTATGG